MFKIDFSRPDLLYAVIWTVTLFLTTQVPVAYIVPMNSELFILVIANIVSFLVIYFLVSRTIRSKLRDQFVIPVLVVKSLSSFIMRLFVFWMMFYLVVVAFSGGIPLLWKILGVPKNYMDFGVPSLSGFLNMIRAFIVAGCVFVYMTSGRISTSLKIVFTVILLFSVAEFTRANFIVLILHGLGVWLFFTRVDAGKVMKLSLLFVLFMVAFGYVGNVRGGPAAIRDSVGDAVFFLNLPSGFFWVYTYIASPLNNLSYAMNIGIDSHYYPFFTLQTIVPSVFREFLFVAVEYPVELVTEAFNATSYYSPFIVDFGVNITFFLVLFIQTLVAYVHCKAKQGKIFFILCYPPLFMCILLSFFYNFFFSMVVVLYPVLVFLYMRYHRNYVRRIISNQIV